MLAAQHTYSMQNVLLKVFWKRIITHMKTYVINTDTEWNRIVQEVQHLLIIS